MSPPQLWLQLAICTGLKKMCSGGTGVGELGERSLKISWRDCAGGRDYGSAFGHSRGAARTAG